MSVGGIVNGTAASPGSPQHPQSPGAAWMASSPRAQQQQQQQGLQQSPAAAPLLHEAVQLSAALSSSLQSNPAISPEEAAGAVQVLVLGLGQQLQAFAEQLVLLQQENQQLQEDGLALAGDFEACATNLQSLVATVAFTIPVGDEVQQGLNSRDAAVFDETLAALHEAIKVHVESEKSLLADSINSGPVAELQGRLHEAEAQLAEATGTVQQMRHGRQEDAVRFEEGLIRARNEAADGAEVARKESLAGLKAELAAMKVREGGTAVGVAPRGCSSRSCSSVGQRCLRRSMQVPLISFVVLLSARGSRHVPQRLGLGDSEFWTT
ncbi:hypothetical protein COO60DRAFT_642348 [Scenedesmus sp. NREL 46B-D3]|nr:hypothetical protein COO60DRAFT_642348 [Scenedesmus sp. NREL 46B-D3]